MRKSLTGKKASEETKEKIRCRIIKHIENKKLNGAPMMPNVGTYEHQTLNILEECLNSKILRQYFVGGFFLDGYCPALNLAIEIDEKHHKYINEKPRENFIKNRLNCKFLRVAVS